MDASPRAGGFHDRDMSLVPEEEDEGGWDSCIMEGYLQIRGGKMGDGKHKQKYFRMRDTMMVMYKKKSPKGKYGKGSTRYLKRDTLYAVSLDAPECQSLRAKGDAANSFLLVCTDRVLRLAAQTEGQRDDWVSAISTHLIRSAVILKGSEMGLARVGKVLKRMGKNSKMAKITKPLDKYYKNLEAECQRDYAVAKVLERVEAAEASGRAVDLEAAQATQEAFWQAQEAMEAIKAHIDVSAVMSLCEDLGLRQSEFDYPRAQLVFQHEFHAAKNMFKGLQHDDDDDDENDWHLFPTPQVYEGAMGMSQKEDARRQQRVWVAVYEDKMAFWKAKKAKMKGKRPTGYFEMSELMQADNTAHQNFQVVHFNAKRSAFFFTANAVETERWLDVVSHAMIAYNSKEKEAKAYDKKWEVVEDCTKVLMRTVRSKKKSPAMWRYFVLYLHGYNLELFERLREIRSQANAQRVHVTSANPHMMKRRVAAQLDDLVSTLAVLKACIAVMPMVEEYSRQIRVKQDHTEVLLEMVGPKSAKKTLKGIGDMLACDVDFGEYLGGHEGDDNDEGDDSDDAEYSGDEDD